ncbi:MAG: hypothetical protein IPF66_24300 [Holophagales bacterium]|nr:hypothetical protein [Holophagales bacterium]
MTWAAAAVVLAILSGGATGEILALRWKVNLEEGFARLPDSKSGKPPIPSPSPPTPSRN